MGDDLRTYLAIDVLDTIRDDLRELKSDMKTFIHVSAEKYEVLSSRLARLETREPASASDYAALKTRVNTLERLLAATAFIAVGSFASFIVTQF